MRQPRLPPPTGHGPAPLQRRAPGQGEAGGVRPAVYEEVRGRSDGGGDGEAAVGDVAAEEGVRGAGVGHRRAAGAEGED